jgi:adenosylcobyric acid synthase
MDSIRVQVAKELQKGDIGSNTECLYHPCHFSGQNCSFCYCPFYPCMDPDLGYNVKSRKGKDVWSCEDCLFIHRDDVVAFVMQRAKELNLEAGDPRFISEVLPEAKRRFFHLGKAIMVVGATSDAGKSVTVAALCRILHRMGYIVAPFKSQNMSLNSRVTPKGAEIAMIQVLQSQAAGMRNPNEHMNPILMKPKGNTMSQVIVEGKPVGDFSAQDYYNKFVPKEGVEAVRRNIDFLKKRCDFVVMEGAGSPAEINIYDKEIANMKAAEIADADCILVVNVKWGGSFAYALGTVKLIPEKDRKRIKGIILNNIEGNIDYFMPGAKELERLCGIPVIGVIPHLDVDLPSEDSEAFRRANVRGNGKLRIAVVRFPRISNFTDLDPLSAEDCTVIFADKPEQILRADAVVLPGTKNTIDDLQWMRDNGIADALAHVKGKVPILGICGGYQMMGKVLHDPNGIEGKAPGDYPGLGLFDNESYWKDYSKVVRRDRAEMIDGGGEVEGYEIHMGLSDVKEKPLFRITDRGREGETEGSVREDEMLFGTYMHGALDRPAFRRKFISMIKHDGESAAPEPPVDYGDVVEEALDELADGFEAHLDMDKFKEIAGVPR